MLVLVAQDCVAQSSAIAMVAQRDRRRTTTLQAIALHESVSPDRWCVTNADLKYLKQQVICAIQQGLILSASPTSCDSDDVCAVKMMLSLVPASTWWTSSTLNPSPRKLERWVGPWWWILMVWSVIYLLVMLGRKASLNSFRKFWGHGPLLPAMRGAACLQTHKIWILAPCCNLQKHLPLHLLCKPLATCWLYPTVTPACTVDFGAAMKRMLHLKKAKIIQIATLLHWELRDLPRPAHKNCSFLVLVSSFVSSNACFPCLPFTKATPSTARSMMISFCLALIPLGLGHLGFEWVVTSQDLVIGRWQRDDSEYW